MHLSFDDLLSSILANLVSSIFLLVIGFIAGKSLDWTTRVRAFRKIFGKRAGKQTPLYIVLDTLRDTRQLAEAVQQSMSIRSPQPDPSGARYYKLFPDNHYTWLPGPTGALVPECSARAAGYLIGAFRGIRKITTATVSDSFVAHKRDGSFISLGSSYSNSVSDDIKLQAENPWLKNDAGSFELKDGTTIKMAERSDKGIILKLPNVQFRGHTRVLCAGLGEWGTSGSAWFLSNNWMLLSRRFGSHPFLLIVSVTPGSDESAMEILARGNERLSWRAFALVRKFWTRGKEWCQVGAKRTEPGQPG